MGLEDKYMEHIGGIDTDRLRAVSYCEPSECGPLRLWWENVAMRYNDGKVYDTLSDEDKNFFFWQKFAIAFVDLSVVAFFWWMPIIAGLIWYMIKFLMVIDQQFIEYESFQ